MKAPKKETARAAIDTLSIMEAVADFAFNAGWQKAVGNIDFNDSRQFIHDLIFAAEKFAKEFEAKVYQPGCDEDYMLDVDKAYCEWAMQYETKEGQMARNAREEEEEVPTGEKTAGQLHRERYGEDGPNEEEDQDVSE
jgi:hypothetical protein